MHSPLESGEAYRRILHERLEQISDHLLDAGLAQLRAKALYVDALWLLCKCRTLRLWWARGLYQDGEAENGRRRQQR